MSVILIDIVLAGDNAIIIGMAARNLPREIQKKTIIWGTMGAVIIRVLATALLAVILEVPGIHLIGGLLLLWIAYKLLKDRKKDHCVKECTSFWSAVGTIIAADAAMGIDNIIAVAGASHGNILILFAGLMISIPIVVWGSTMIIKLIDRFPVIIYVGAAVIAYTAAGMITKEPMIAQFLISYPQINWLITFVAVIVVVSAGLINKNRPLKEPANK